LLNEGKLYVFTTRADTIMGVTFCAVAAEHPLAQHAARDNPELQAFIAECKLGSVIEADMATMEKKGMPTGLCVAHPLTGEQVPVWVGNYVLMNYGDGAVMGVPAHDERDFAFAKKYDLPIQQVVDVPGETFSLDGWQDWYGDKTRGVLVNSGRYDGMDHTAAVNAVSGDLAEKELGDKKVTFRLRDWGISRQRYWGTPIPMIHCAHCGVVPVPKKDLPVVLPEDCVPDGTGNPLKKHEAFLKVDCPKCGAPARRETDTMDTFVDSSWYYMRYTSPGSDDAMVDAARNDYWMPMDQYIGGIEHAVLHLLYARFWTKVMRDFGLVKFDEPFVNLLTQGMVLNETYYREDESGKKTWFNPADVDLVFDDRGRPQAAASKLDGAPVIIGGTEKMSKSKNNGIDPAAQIGEYGADTARLFTMFASPPEQTLEWSETGVEGASRFLRRVWAFGFAQRGRIAAALAGQREGALDEAEKTLRREVHKVLQQADYDFKRIQYNTVVSACMKMLNTLESSKLADGPAGDAVITEGLSIFLRMLNPVAPHITHALWQDLGYATVYGDILDVQWPEVDPAALEQAEIEMMIQVNGKLRGSVRVAKDADKATIEAAALASEAVQKFVEGTPKKVIVVPGKLINIVV
jgi:leucyl-tRNA synthetase